MAAPSPAAPGSSSAVFGLSPIGSRLVAKQRNRFRHAPDGLSSRIPLFTDSPHGLNYNIWVSLFKAHELRPILYMFTGLRPMGGGTYSGKLWYRGLRPKFASSPELAFITTNLRPTSYFSTQARGLPTSTADPLLNLGYRLR